MPPQDPNQTNLPPDIPQPGTPNPLAVMQAGEQIIFELKRHPIGIFIIYVMTGIVLTVLALAAFVLAPDLMPNNDRNQIETITGLVFVTFALLCLAFNYIATIVYWGNRWILTDDSITQITRTSLFRKESSSLGLESLEDVTAEQNGILSHLFGYGTLKAETAGHRSKFVFIYCPNPNKYAQQILEAREAESIERAQYGAHEDEPHPSPPAGQQRYVPPQPPAGPPSPPSDNSGFTSNY